MPKDTPLVIFLVGIFGASNESYAREIARMVAKKKWKMVIINRRGWNFSPLSSERIF